MSYLLLKVPSDQAVRDGQGGPAYITTAGAVDSAGPFEVIAELPDNFEDLVIDVSWSE